MQVTSPTTRKFADVLGEQHVTPSNNRTYNTSGAMPTTTAATLVASAAAVTVTSTGNRTAKSQGNSTLTSSDQKLHIVLSEEPHSVDTDDGDVEVW